jgi:hypothetical protein
MAVSKPQSKPSLDRAKAVLREQWSEVIQHLGDRFVSTERYNKSKLCNLPYLTQAQSLVNLIQSPELRTRYMGCNEPILSINHRFFPYCGKA